MQEQTLLTRAEHSRCSVHAQIRRLVGTDAIVLDTAPVGLLSAPQIRSFRWAMRAESFGSAQLVLGSPDVFVRTSSTSSSLLTDGALMLQVGYIQIELIEANQTDWSENLHEFLLSRL